MVFHKRSTDPASRVGTGDSLVSSRGGCLLSAGGGAALRAGGASSVASGVWTVSWRGAPLRLARGVVGRRRVNASLLAPTRRRVARFGPPGGGAARCAQAGTAVDLRDPALAAAIGDAGDDRADDGQGDPRRIEIAREARVDDRRQQLVRTGGLRPRRRPKAGRLGPGGPADAPPQHADWTPGSSGSDEP
jgi:hypothetical protein